MTTKIRRKILYTRKELQDAFNAWIREPVHTDEHHLNKMRTLKWYTYCDIRDGLPIGSSQQRALIINRSDTQIISSINARAI